MKIGIVGSVQHADKILAIRDKLVKLGHTTLIQHELQMFDGKFSDKNIEIDPNFLQDSVRAFWNEMQGADAILVVNGEKEQNYIDGNMYMEIGLSYALQQKIFFLNPIPDMPYKAEILAMKPIVIDGDLNKIA